DPKGMTILNAKTGEQLAFTPTTVVSQPVEAIYSEDHFWVLNLDPVSFVEIDAKTGKVLQHLASPVADIGFYGVHGNDLWITNYTQPELVQVDIRRRQAVNRFILSDDPGYPAGGGGLF